MAEQIKYNKAFSAISIKSIDEDKREIHGMASTPALDRVKDIVEPLGLTFDAGTPLMLNHDHSQPVGTVTFGTPTVKGLPFTASIAKVEDPGVVKNRTDEAWHSVKAGLIKGVSIGFIPSEYEPIEKGGVRFTKAHVHELSLTAIPCNPEAMITAFKSLASLEVEVLAATEVVAPVVEAPVVTAPRTDKLVLSYRHYS